MITVIDIQIGNIASVTRALAFLGIPHGVSTSPEEVLQADKIIFPGVGSFSEAMKRIREVGWDAVLTKKVIEQKTPILGICLGMQLFATEGTEGGRTKGLCFIQGRVSYHRAGEKGLRLPHIGWNEVRYDQGKIFSGIPNESCFYFVHSYEFIPDEGRVVARSRYGIDFVAAVQKEHIIGVQFHPEKSQQVGLALLKNFCTGVM